MHALYWPCAGPALPGSGATRAGSQLAVGAVRPAFLLAPRGWRGRFGGRSRSRLHGHGQFFLAAARGRSRRWFSTWAAGRVPLSWFTQPSPRRGIIPQFLNRPSSCQSRRPGLSLRSPFSHRREPDRRVNSVLLRLSSSLRYPPPQKAQHTMSNGETANGAANGTHTPSQRYLSTRGEDYDVHLSSLASDGRLIVMLTVLVRASCLSKTSSSRASPPTAVCTSPRRSPPPRAGRPGKTCPSPRSPTTSSPCTYRPPRYRPKTSRTS